MCFGAMLSSFLLLAAMFALFAVMFMVRKSGRAVG